MHDGLGMWNGCPGKWELDPAKSSIGHDSCGTTGRAVRTPTAQRYDLERSDAFVTIGHVDA